MIIDIRVVHLSTSHFGGAGIAARRLNELLNSAGLDSTFYSISRKSFDPLHKELAIDRNFLRQVTSAITASIAKFFTKTSFYSFFSSSAVSTRWLVTLLADGKTVLHIHNWFNLLSLKQISRLVELGYPIIITLHDQRLMTAGCHTPLECQGFKEGCEACPMLPTSLQASASRKLSKFGVSLQPKHTNLGLIAPSKFMVEESRQSSVLREKPVVFIPNIVPDRFMIQSGSILNQKTKDRTIKVGVASVNPLDPLKGGDLVSELINRSNSYGSKFEILQLAQFHPDRSNEFWKAIDCILVASKGDNSPNVIHEAKMVGKPVIATKVGGITELLSLPFDIGIELDELSIDTLLSSISEIQLRKDSEHMINQMRVQFENYTQDWLANLDGVYRAVLDSSKKIRFEG